MIVEQMTAVVVLISFLLRVGTKKKRRGEGGAVSDSVLGSLHRPKKRV